MWSELSEWDSANEVHRVRWAANGRVGAGPRAQTNPELQAEKRTGTEMTGASVTAIRGHCVNPRAGMHPLLFRCT